MCSCRRRSSSARRFTGCGNAASSANCRISLIEIHRLESVGDDNNHAAVSELYNGSTDALEVIKWKEFYDMIEEAIDACEDVGNTLERIVLKNG